MALSNSTHSVMGNEFYLSLFVIGLSGLCGHDVESRPFGIAGPSAHGIDIAVGTAGWQGGGHDVVDIAVNIGGIARAHQGFGGGRVAGAEKVGVAAGFEVTAAAAWAGSHEGVQSD